MNSALARLTLGLLVLFGFTSSTYAQPTSGFAIQVSALIQDEPPQITLTWPVSDGALSYTVSRKLKGDTNFGPPTVLPGSSSFFSDADVLSGQSYEYQIARATAAYNTYAYIATGIAVPLNESRGKALLVVDQTHAGPLATELARLHQDLVGDGWSVLRYDVPRQSVSPSDTNLIAGQARSFEVTQLKRLIQSAYYADPTNVQAVFLIGHVPVPYSGVLAPDQHPDHRGAWPADAYYGDISGLWTDSTAKSASVLDLRNQNVVGDGKFDQSSIPGQVALQIGRVDMANLSYFETSEVEMLRQYLNKDHDFRHRILTARPRALVDDNLGVLIGEVPAVVGWDNFAPFFGPFNTSGGRWLSVLPREDYLWAYGCGPGSFTSAGGVVDTVHYLVYDPKVIFTMLFGSYFGDWDSENNLLRAPLGSSTNTLSAVWGGRPAWHFHPFAMGETLGYCARLTQNNAGLYKANAPITSGPVIQIGDTAGLTKGVHVALLGDPTLRMHPVLPPTSLSAATNEAGGVDLNWFGTGEEILGYHVYRAGSAFGPFARLTPALITSTKFTDPAFTDEQFYMVKAVKLEKSSSGSYLNSSQGAFVSVNLATASPDDFTWSGRATRTWNFDDVRGTAGASPGWDAVHLSGPLEVTATVTNRFTVRIVSSAPDGTVGAPRNFSSTSNYLWPIVISDTNITSFDSSKVQLQTSDFIEDLQGGTFSLVLGADGKSINLSFKANRPPTTVPATFFRSWDTPVHLEISELLDGYTHDADGDRRVLLDVGVSTNGTVVARSATALDFTFSNNLPETIPYWVQDVRHYRPGDTLRIAEGTIRIQPVPEALPFSAFHAIEIEWQGQPGQRYQVQSRLQTGTEWINEGESFIATGEKKSLFQRADAETKFYRIILVQ